MEQDKDKLNGQPDDLNEKEQEEVTEHELPAALAKQRKNALLLPIPAVIFLAIAFYLFDGGTGTQVSSAPVAGLNRQLPAKENDTLPDRLTAWGMRVQDSIEKQQRAEFDMPLSDSIQATGNASTGSAGSYSELNSQLADFNKPDEDYEDTDYYGGGTTGGGGDLSATSAQQDKMMELYTKLLEKQLNGDEDKKEEKQPEPAATGQKRKVVAVTKAESSSADGFYTVTDKDKETAEAEGSAIEAVIDRDQTIAEGSTIRLRFLSDVMAGSKLIKANSSVAGVVSLAGERLIVSVSTIAAGKSIIPVSLKIYDLDGLEGIAVPGSVERETAKETLNDIVNGAGTGSISVAMSQSAKQQLMMKGVDMAVNAGKKLLTRKTGAVRVHLKAGYRVLFVNEE